jgi:hypothetical protein
MKKFIAGLCMFLICSISFAEKSQIVAQQLYVPIFCGGQPMGTGFPVDTNLLMTAGHVRCPEGEATTISIDHGKTWISEEDWLVNGDFDVAILTVTGKPFKEFAHFRDPKLGETVSGYGIPYDGLLSTGIVAHLEDYFVFTTNIPIGGMSGSAVVGADGKVVGMVNFGLPDQRVGGTLSGGYQAKVLTDLIKSFKEFKGAK